MVWRPSSRGTPPVGESGVQQVQCAVMSAEEQTGDAWQPQERPLLGATSTGTESRRRNGWLLPLPHLLPGVKCSPPEALTWFTTAGLERTVPSTENKNLYRFLCPTSFYGKETSVLIFLFSG